MDNGRYKAVVTMDLDLYEYDRDAFVAQLRRSSYGVALGVELDGVVSYILSLDGPSFVACAATLCNSMARYAMA